jgi:hypothetical protein
LPHTYTDIYSLLFANIRSQVKNVFECGIGSSDETMDFAMTSNGKPGASLRVWRDYFSNALVWGADIDTKALFEEERIKTGYIDQFSPTAIKQFFQETNVGRFDVMIDDGFHSYEAGISLFENAIDKLADNGIYVIEDISCKGMEKFKEYFQQKNFLVDYIVMNSTMNEGNAMLVIRKNIELLQK